MTYPTRNSSTYTLPNLDVGLLLMENGSYLLTESSDRFLLENPSQQTNLSSRNTSSYTLPSKNTSTLGTLSSRHSSSYTLSTRN